MAFFGKIPHDFSRQSLLRRGAFTAERAYAPDPRALAALFSARAEAMRFETGAVRGGWRMKEFFGSKPWGFNQRWRFFWDFDGDFWGISVILW